jgi:serine protease Do
VSAVNRNILPGREQSGLYLDMIQTDAAINPGNSGGPLANALGEVVGVNSSIFSQSGGSIGLGFAIPIERALRVAEEIVRHGSVRRAWVGFDAAGAESLREWKSVGGVLVRAVAPGGPAERAGLRVGDVLTRANDRTLRNYLDWEAVKLDLRVEDSVRLTYRRREATLTSTLTSGDLPTTTAQKVTVLKDLQLVTLTDQVRAERGVQSDRGALIFSISRELSQSTGLVAGDVIVGINRRRITSADEVRSASRRSPRQAVRMFFEREASIVYTDLFSNDRDRYCSPLGTTPPEMQRLGRTDPHRAVASRLAGAGRKRAGARAGHPSGRARRHAGASGRRRPGGGGRV